MCAGIGWYINIFFVRTGYNMRNFNECVTLQRTVIIKSHCVGFIIYYYNDRFGIYCNA